MSSVRHLRIPSAILAAFFAASLLAAGCAAPTSSRSSDVSSGASTLPVTLPDGTQIRAELAITPEQQARGLMFREALPPNHGMLFISSEISPRAFWMFQTRIPLDIIWLDENRRVVEISAHTPPCGDTNPSNCPNYGGQVPSKYVLELAAGQAEAHGIDVGDQILF
jgi:uncharacterized membrane protein (UPF0127 family)